MANWRKRSFFGRVIRAVARVDIAVVAVAVLTAVVVKTAGLAGAKFAAAYKGKGLAKKLLLGVTKTRKASKTFKWYSATSVGLGPGIVKAAQSWDDNMLLKT